MLSLQEYPYLPPTFQAVGCIFHFSDRVLLLKRINSKVFPSHWGIPSGKIEPSEYPNNAMIRELHEETGIAISVSKLKFFNTYYVIAGNLNFRYIVYSYASDILPEVRISHKEHSSFGWFSFPSATQLKLVPETDRLLKSYSSTSHLRESNNTRL